MSIKSFVIKNLLRLTPTTESADAAGELRVDSSDSNKLKYHDGSSEDAVVLETALDDGLATVATKELDNLTTVALNADLIPGIDNDINIGSPSGPKKMGEVFTHHADIKVSNPMPTYWQATLPTVTLDGTTTEALAGFGAGIFFDGPASSEFFVGTTEQTSTDSSAYLNLRSGDQTGASGDSGFITFTTGNSANGNSGLLYFTTGAAPNGTKGTAQFYQIDLDAGKLYWDATNSVLKLLGTSSGYIGLKAAAASDSTTYTLPDADGSNGDVLTTDGSGITSWETPAGGSPAADEQAFTSGDTINSSSTVVLITPPILDAGVIDTATIITTDGSTVPASSFWDIQSTDIGPAGFYAWVWYNVDSGGTDPTPSSPASQVVRIPIEVAIASTDDEFAVAAATYTAITAMASTIAPYFTVTNPTGTDTFTVSGAFPGGFYAQDAGSTGFSITDPGIGASPTYDSIQTSIETSIQPGATTGQRLTVIFGPPSTSGNSVNAVSGSAAIFDLFEGGNASFGNIWTNANITLQTYNTADFIWTGNVWLLQSKNLA